MAIRKLKCTTDNLITLPPTYSHKGMFVKFASDGKISYSENIWTDGDNIYYSYGSTHYVKNGNTWVTKTWTGLTDFYGKYIWTDGTNIYYSYQTTHYRLNKSTNTWETMTWAGRTNFYGSSVWTDGTNFYLYNNYVLSGTTWNSKSWSCTEFTAAFGFSSEAVWTDGTNIYYSDGYYQLKLNGNTWEVMPDNRVSGSFNARYIWSDGTDTYNGNKKYVNGEWITQDFGPGVSIGKAWTDGENIFSSGRILLPVSHSKIYMRVNDTWQEITQAV